MNEIGIRIFWGPWEGDFNPAPIVSVGNIVGDIVPVVPTLVREEQSWMIKSDENKALYASFSKECCINTDNHIQLLVCVIIPKDQRLADQKSPLDLLEAVKRQFEQLFSYDYEATLPNKEKVDADFGQLLKGYTLTECPWYVFNMEGSNPASFCVDSRAQLDALMRFNAYKELAHVEHLELGFKCKTTVNLNTKGETSGTTQKTKRRWWEKDKEEAQPKPLEKEQPSNSLKKKPEGEVEKEKPVIEEDTHIVAEPEKPKSKGYRVIVNGQPAKDPRNPEKEMILWEGSDEQYTVRCDSTLDYRYEPLTISIEKLRKASDVTLTSQDGSSKAVLDEATQSIVCTLNPIAKWYKKNIKFDPKSDDDAERYCKKYLGGIIKIQVGGQDWNDDLIKPSMVTEQRKDGIIILRKDLFSISPNETDSFRFSVSKVKIDLFYNNLCIYIRAERKRIGRRGGRGNKLTTLWKALKAQWMVAAIGFALGVGGFWAMQAIIRNLEERRIEKQEKSRETSAWNNLKDLTPKNPSQANSYRDYLRNFSKGEYTIRKGDDVRETIKGSFGYLDLSHVANARQKLQEYVDDSIQAEQDEEKAFNACVDIAACDNYLENYNLVQAHQYFVKGKHVDEVIEKKRMMEDARPKHQKKMMEQEIKDEVAQMALEYLNKQDLKGFRQWLHVKNKEWNMEFFESMKNRALLGKEKNNAVEWILNYRGLAKNRMVEREIMHYLKDELNFPNTPFESWVEVLKAKKRIDEIVRKYEHDQVSPE